MLSYKDIVITPAYSEIISRSRVNTEVKFGPKKFLSPAMPANMICTIDFKKAEELSENKYFYVLHRFYDYKEIYQWIKNNQDLRTISISIGVGQKDKDLIYKICKNKLKVDYITIDVAHGHHILVKEMVKYVKNILPKPFLIAGNVGTSGAVASLSSWGADAVKVGLSMGKSCTTYNCTGVGTPMFSTLESIKFDMDQKEKFSQHSKNVPIIADGQIREVGDVCKALAVGATMVMIGSEFASCEDSPAKTVDGKKEFFGSASQYTKGHDSFIEGEKVILDIKHKSYLSYFNKIKEGIQSFLSYIGQTDIKNATQCTYNILCK
jgi:GMP reductase